MKKLQFRKGSSAAITTQPQNFQHFHEYVRRDGMGRDIEALDLRLLCLGTRLIESNNFV